MNYDVSMTQRENGHSEPSQIANNTLYVWCRRQREAYNNNILGQKEIELLEQVNFRFEKQTKDVTMWKMQYRKLVAFYVSINSIGD